MYNYFKETIDAKGISVADVARGTGITKSTFSDWKSGRCSPKIDKMMKIADFLEVSVEYLTTGKNAPEFVMPEYDAREHELIEKYGNLDDIQKNMILELTKQLAEKNYIIHNYYGTGKTYNGILANESIKEPLKHAKYAEPTDSAYTGKDNVG